MVNIVFLYKKKGKGFLGVKTVYDSHNNYKNAKYYDLDEKKEIELFHSLLDEKFEYMYSLQIKRTKMRTYNEVKSRKNF